MALWFLAIGILGAYGILRHPGVFAKRPINPIDLHGGGRVTCAFIALTTPP
jgi:hypothetical protein